MRAFVALFLLLLVACSKPSKQAPIAAALEKLADGPSKMVLYSLNPGNNHDESEHTDTIFHGFDVLGKAEITDRSEQRALLRALARGAGENDDTAAACFNPRHALHIEQDGRAIDFTICFECLQVQARGFEPGGFLTSASPEPTFDDSVRRHNLRMPPKLHGG